MTQTTDLTLTGAQQKRLHAALLDAFPSASALKMFAQFDLEKKLGDITQGALAEVVFGLMEWATAHGRLRELVDKAHAYVPGNPQLRAFVASLAPVADARVVEDLRDIRAVVTATLAQRPKLADALGTRLSVTRDGLVEQLVDRLSARDVADHLNAIDDVLASADGDPDDRRACRAMLFKLLPAATDWNQLRAAMAQPDAERPRPVTLPYRLDTIAEIVLAGLHNRACRYVLEERRMPVGLGLVRLPASSQAPLFDAEGKRLVESVIEHLARKFMIDRDAKDLQGALVDAELERTRRATGEARLQYYLLFHDAEHPSPRDADHFWSVTCQALGNGVKGLQAVRMSRSPQDFEAALAVLVRAVVQKERP